MKLMTTIILVACGATACASYPKPVDRLATAQGAVRAAREVNAQASPQGALHLKYAEEEITQAKSQIANDDNQHAESTLMRAEADAEVAIALAKESVARADADQAAQRSRDVQRDQH